MDAFRARGTGRKGDGVYGGDLAAIYDATYGFKDYAADVDYLRAVIDRHHPSAASLLETAAGTGRYLELLRPHFRAIEGLDLSASMLLRAAQRVPGVPLHVADMVDFELGRRFDVVCCLFRSIAYCRTVERMHAAVAAMARHLEDGGLLLIEPFFTPRSYWVGRVTLNHCESAEGRIACMYASERDGRLARMRMHFLVGTGSGVEHFEEVHELGLFEEDDFRTAFAAAGLEFEHDPRGPTGVGLYIGRRSG